MPPGGWETVTEENHRDIAKNIPVVLPGENWTFPFIFITLPFTPGVLYSYLAEGVGHSAGKGAFRALSCGLWPNGEIRGQLSQPFLLSCVMCHEINERWIIHCVCSPREINSHNNHSTCYVPMYCGVSIITKKGLYMHNIILLPGYMHHVPMFLPCFLD